MIKFFCRQKKRNMKNNTTNEEGNFQLKLKEKYPDRTAIIIDAHKDIGLNRLRYLVPNTCTWSEFMVILRKRISLGSEQALYFFVNGTIPRHTDMVSVLAETESDVNGIMHVTLTKESTFG